MDDDSPPETIATGGQVTIPIGPAGAPLHVRLGNLAAQKQKIADELAKASRYAVRKPDPKNKQQVALAAEEPDGKIIANPVYHMAMIDRMTRFLDVDLRVHQQVYDIDRAKEYLARISGIVGGALAKIDPDLHREVLEQFKALNREFQIGQGG